MASDCPLPFTIGASGCRGISFTNVPGVAVAEVRLEQRAWTELICLSRLYPCISNFILKLKEDLRVEYYGTNRKDWDRELAYGASVDSIKTYDGS
jgi:hypothetical protein